MYINTATLEKEKLHQIKQTNPNVSLPRNPTDTHLAPLGYAILHPTTQPAGDVVTEGVPEQDTDGNWNQTWDVRSFTPTEAQEALDQAKQQAFQRINNSYTEQMEAAVAKYPKVERDTWGKQEQEARAWKNNGVSSTPFIDSLVSTKPGKDKQVLADKIIAKADALADITGQLTGKRHDLEADIEAAYLANDRATLESITW